jgi:hypothetical protein
MGTDKKRFVPSFSFVVIGLLVMEIPATTVASTSAPILTSTNNLFNVINRNGRIASISSDKNDTDANIKPENITDVSGTLFSGNNEHHYLKFIRG